MVAEANIESHGMGYGESTLAKEPKYAKAHMERNTRNVAGNFNHPAIIFWSLGNEAGYGPNFEECYNWVKNEDPSRPVQYERAGQEGKTDIFCPMYFGYDGMKWWGERTDATMPLIQCEYAHAMGNSLGGFKEYWDIIRKYPNLQGGFIWDFVDQAVRKKGKDGVEIYGYGGDFNKYDASDQNFCVNGVVNPDRIPNPHADEIAYYYQNIWTNPLNLKEGKIQIYNENFFKDLSDTRLDWTLLNNGVPVRTGQIDKIEVAPGKTADITIPYGSISDEGEWMLNVYYVLKESDGLLPAGHIMARQQFALNEVASNNLDMKGTKEANNTSGTPVIDNRQANVLGVNGDNFRIEFNRGNGYLCSFVVNGKELINEGGALTPNFWRPPTDNDYGAWLQQKYRVWKNPEIRLTGMTSEEKDGLIFVKAEYDMPEVAGKLTMGYVINAGGEVLVTEDFKVTEGKEVPNMFRFGLQLQMPEKYNAIEYYGRGPIENYWDRNNSTFVGLYNQSVAEQFYPYVRAQETGLKTDVRYWKQLDKSGSGLEFISDEPFSASALNYSIESLDGGIIKQNTHSPEIQKVDYTNVCLDKVHMGLACENSWGAIARPEYRVPYGNYTFRIMLKPVTHQVKNL